MSPKLSVVLMPKATRALGQRSRGPRSACIPEAGQVEGGKGSTRPPRINSLSSSSQAWRKILSSDLSLIPPKSRVFAAHTFLQQHGVATQQSSKLAERVHPGMLACPLVCRQDTGAFTSPRRRRRADTQGSPPDVFRCRALPPTIRSKSVICSAVFRQPGSKASSPALRRRKQWHADRNRVGEFRAMKAEVVAKRLVVVGPPAPSGPRSVRSRVRRSNRAVR